METILSDSLNSKVIMPDYEDNSNIIESGKTCTPECPSEIPTKLSLLIDDVGFVKDPIYLHTDNNLTDEYKNILDSSIEMIPVLDESKKVLEESKLVLDESKVANEEVRLSIINSNNATQESILATNDAKLATEETKKVIEGVQDSINAANSAAQKAEQSALDALKAADRGNELANNPPKIINDTWWIYNEILKLYEDTGIKAVGDSFSYVREYVSIEAMEADFLGTDVKVGQHVIINTNNVEDPDDAKVYLKTELNWKFIVDLSGMLGIHGWSAYEIAVNKGFIGTEDDWLQSLKLPALDAALQALDAKSSIEVTLNEIKASEELRNSAELKRISNENTRIDLENTRESSENLRIQSETTRIDNENQRDLNETQRISNEDQRKSDELLRVESEETREQQEQTRIASETTRQENEVTRLQLEELRQTNSSTAIENINKAKQDTELATKNANEATASTNTAINKATAEANRAKEYSDNPPKIELGYWYLWDETTKQYKNTNVKAEGDPGKSPKIQDGTWWVYDVELGIYINTGIAVNSTYELTKQKVEDVLTGEITTHTHDNRYYTEDEIDKKLADFLPSLTVIDNLESNSSTDPLSAKQGKVLKGLVDGKQPKGNYLEEIPIASKDKIGGFKVGTGLEITPEGTLNTTGGGVADSVNWKNIQDKPKHLADWNAVEGETSIANKPIIPSLDGYAKEDWVNQQNFLKEVPAEYVTETELGEKNFATKNELTEIFIRRW